MRKPLQYRITGAPQMKKELIQLIGDSLGIDYYTILKTLNANAADVAAGLGKLVISGKIIKLKDTPNPTYQLVEDQGEVG
jgi:hypothetical protein